jgi:hypothetical protein
MVLFIAVLAFPMLRGKWLAAPSSDQYASAYAVHEWQAEQWRASGQLPLWNPMIMDGLPYIAVVTHGDVLYPTSFLRWFWSADKVTDFGFVLHYILAGLFMYLLLRRLRISWVGSVVGGLAYQLSGIIVSYARPGHDGKLFVSTMLPLACLALLAALRDRRGWGYPLLSVAVALCLLSPHVQTTYYLLIATGLFSLYLTFGEPTTEPLGQRLTRLGLVLIAVIAGFGVAMPQIMPFLQYIPHSPRAVAYSGAFENAASYGVPWDHVLGFMIAGFTGESGTYWGSNPIKLHSEYLGLPVVALAILGLARGGPDRRRLIWWMGGICVLFLLIALSNATPFYRLWWSVMPYVRKTRAPGMVFFVVAFCTALFAGLGANRLEQKDGEGHVRAWLIAAGVIALLGIAGVFGHLAEAMAQPGRGQLAEALGPRIRVSAFIGAALLFGVALLAFSYVRGKAPLLALALGLPFLVGVDLWRDGRRFWLYSDPPNQTLYRDDAIVTRLRAEPKPYRVLDPANVYPENVLMAHDIPQVLGYQGNELRYFDELIGGRPGTENGGRYLLTSTKLWDLLAVRFLLIPDTIRVPGYHRVMGPVETAAGSRAFLYQADTEPPYARVVPAALKLDADSLVPPTLADPRMPGYDRIVLLGPTAPVNPAPLKTLPAASASRARVTSWNAGRMTVVLDPPPRDSSYVLIAENWYLDWTVKVDGQPGQVLRGDHALLTIPVGPGAKHLELSYYSRSFTRGKAIGLVTLLLVIAALVVPPAWKRRRPSA